MDDGRPPARGAEATGRSFDPRPHLRRIETNGRASDYLDVKWRLVWLRTEHPDARITTEHVTLTDQSAVFRATVEIPGGGRATGYGSERREDFSEYIETAETKAIGRALAALGYGTQFVPDFEIEAELESAPEPPADAPLEAASQTVEERRPEPVTSDTLVEPERPANVYELSRAERPAIQERPASAPREPFDPADYNWNEFWKWAKPLGYKDRGHVAELLGRELGDLTPHEVRRLLVQYRRDQGQE